MKKNITKTNTKAEGANLVSANQTKATKNKKVRNLVVIGFGVAGALSVALRVIPKTSTLINFADGIVEVGAEVIKALAKSKL